MPSLLKIARIAAFSFILASCGAGSPAFAQACPSLESVLEQAAEAGKAGVEVHVLTGDKAVAALAVLVEKLGPPPRTIEITTAIVLIGPGSAVIVLGESTVACFSIALPRSVGAEIVAKVTGVPA